MGRARRATIALIVLLVGVPGTSGIASSDAPEYICPLSTATASFANPTNQAWKIVFVETR